MDFVMAKAVIFFIGLGALCFGYTISVIWNWWHDGGKSQKVREWICRHFGHKPFRPPKGIPVSMDTLCQRCGNRIGD